MITPAQCRAARALLDWSQNELSRRARLTLLTVQSFERGRDRKEITAQALEAALVAAGVQFLETESALGVMVRKRKDT
jgi:transcriptional regulator with XRE-family HTH domain